MSDDRFKKYSRTQISEMRPVTDEEVNLGRFLTEPGSVAISISETDLKNGSPTHGDMIARNPKNPNDQWLVAKEYFIENFEPIN